MTLVREYGTFTKTTSTSTPVAQQVTLSNGSLTPKAFIAWTNGLTTEGTYTEGIRWSYGFSDGTNDACQQMSASDNNTTQLETYSFNNDAVISIVDQDSQTEISRADVSSFGAGVVNLNWSVQSDTNAIVIHYIVIGGDDITNASVVSTTVGDTGTGNHSYNGSGSTFTPKFALTMTGADQYTTANSLSSGADRALMSIGAARSATEEYCMAGRTETVGTADTDQVLLSDACLVNTDPTSGAIDFEANFVSFDSAAGGGITVNIVNSATSGSQLLAFLFLEVASTTGFEVGTFQQRSGTGTQDVSFSNTNLDPSLTFLSGINSDTAGSVVANNYLAMGASDGTNEGCTWCGDQNAATNMVNTSVNLTTKVYRQATPNATASSSTTNAECDMTGMSTRGQFTLDWTTADTTQRQIGFWVIGEVPLFVTQTSIHKYNMSAMVQSDSKHKYHLGPQFLHCKTGTITKDTTTGAHTQNFTNELGFAPSAMMFLVTHRTSAGTSELVRIGMGFSDGTNHFSNSAAQETINNSDANNRSSSTSCIHLINDTNSALLFAASATFGSNGFDLVYSDADNIAYKIGYIAWGGGVIENAKVAAQTHAGSGSQSYTNIGFGGDVAIFLANTCADNGTDTSNVGIGIGVATPTNQWAITTSSNSGFVTDTARSQVTDKCIRVHTGGGAGSFITDAAFTEFTSTGYTLNYTSGTTADVFGVLVIKGGLWDAGTFNQATSNGTQQVNITADRTPLGVLLSTFGNTASASVQNEWRFSLGASDVTSNTSVWTGMADNISAGNRTNDSDYSDTKCLRCIAPGSTPTLETEMDMDSFASGSFTVDNTTTDGTSRQICFLAVSDLPPESEPVSQTSIHKYHLFQNALQTSIHKYNIIQYTSQANIHKYHILNDIFQTNVHKYDIINNALQTSVHKYDLIQYILSNNIQKYDIRNDIVQVTIQKYNILNNVLQSAIHKYDIIAYVLSQSIHKYDIIAYVLNNSIQKYNILNNLIQSSIQKYNILNNALQTSIHKYDIIQNIIQSSIHKYNIIQNILQTSIHKYDIINNVIQNTIHKYDIFNLNAVLQTTIHKYNIINNVINSNIHKYNILNDIIQSNIHKYNILNNISQTSIHKYNIINDIIQTSVHKYNILNDIIQSSIHKYDIIENIIQSSIHKYNIIQNILQTSIHKYDIINIGQVIQTTIHKYHILENLISNNIHKYNILNNVSQTNIHKYNVLENIINSSIQKYNILNNILQSNIHKYNILQNVLSSSIHKYDIISQLLVLAETIHKYGIIQYISNTTIHKYNLGLLTRRLISEFGAGKRVERDSVSRILQDFLKGNWGI